MLESWEVSCCPRGAGAGASCTHMVGEKLSLKQMEIEAAALPGTGLLPALVAASCWLVLIRVMSETVDYTENSLGEVLLLSSVHLQATPNVSTRRSNRPSPHVAQEGSRLLQLC